MKLYRLLFVLLFPALLFNCKEALAVEKTPAEKLEEAALVIEEIMGMPEKGIPVDLLKKCRGVAIFPGVIKAGFVIGGKYGEGVILAHDPETNGFSPPAFFSIAGGSFGWQIGAQSIDLVLLIMSDDGLDGIMKSKFTLGADASIAAGPVGRQTEAGIDATLKAAVLSYSRSKGLFIGLSLEGAVITEQVDKNRAFYGKDVSADTLFREGVKKTPPGAERLIETIEKYLR